MWDNVKTQFVALLRYQDYSIYQTWKNGKNSPSSTTCQDIDSSNYVDQSVKYLLELAKSDSRSGICLGFVITYALLWCAKWILMKPFFSGSVIAVMFLCHNLWVDCIWPEISVPGTEQNSSSKRFLLTKELNSQLQKIYPFVSEVIACTTKLRNYNHELFCVSSTVFFLTVASVGSVLPGLYWAQILLIAMWFAKFGLQSIGTKPMNNWSSPEMEDLVPELTDDTLLVLEKATASTKQNETFEDGLVPVSPGDPTFGLHFSQSHFESLGSDFEDDFEVISSDELSE